MLIRLWFVISVLWTLVVSYADSIERSQRIDQRMQAFSLFVILLPWIAGIFLFYVGRFITTGRFTRD